MKMIKSQKARLICAVCGNDIMLDALQRSSYSYKCNNGKKYPVFEYHCPACKNTTFISQKVLDDFSEEQ